MSRYFLLPDHSEITLKNSPPPQECAYPECPNREEGYTDKKLLLCSRCKEVQYCDKACQVPHWKAEHKTACTGGLQQFKKWLDSRLPMVKWATRHALQVDTTDKIVDHYFCISNQRRADIINGILDPTTSSRFIEAVCRKKDDLDIRTEASLDIFNKSTEETRKMRAEGGIGEAIAVVIIWPLCVIEKVRFEGKPDPRPKYNRSWAAIVQGVLNDVIAIPADVLEEIGGTWAPIRDSSEKGKAVEDFTTTNGTAQEDSAKEKEDADESNAAAE